MNDRCARARALVVEALEAVDAELARPVLALPRAQLGECRATLAGYLDTIDRDALPPRRERREGLGRLVLDCWPYGLPLGDAILRAERAWRTC